MVKRLKSTVLASVVSVALISTVTVIPAFAENEPQFSLSDADCYAGDNVTITLNCNNNPGVTAWKVDVYYDSEALQLVSCDTDSVFGDAIPSQTIEENPYTVSWSNDIKDVTVNGKMAAFTFKIKEEASAGDYKIRLTYDEDNVYSVELDENGNEKNVYFDTKDGIITVKEKNIPVTGITLPTKELTLTAAGDTFKITPTVIPDNATNKKVTYHSDNTDVATVDSDGVVKAVANGSSNITVTTQDGEYSAVCAITVAIPHKHVMSKIDAKQSTCLTKGNNEYYFCEECGKYFKDVNGDIETTTDAEMLDLSSHDFTKQVASEKYIKSSANCVSKAVYYYSCSVCGKIGSETFEYGDCDKSNHVGKTKVVGQKEATCDESGYTGDVVCSACDEVIKLGEVITENGHTPSDVWSTDDVSHWKECMVGCGTIIDKAAHIGGTATCHSKAVCEVCSAEYGEFNTNNHSGEIEVRDAIEVTTSQNGYTGDKYCLSCGELVEKGTIIPKIVEESSEDESPVEESSEDESSVEEPSEDESSVEESSEDESPVEESSKDESSVEESNKDESSVKESSKDESSVVKSSHVEGSTNDNKTANSVDTNTPGTGDGSSVFLVMFALLISGLSAMFVFKKKNHN